jgi:acyl carrier protein
MKTIEQTVKDIIVEQGGCDAVEVKLESRFDEDLGCDSLDCMEILIALEEEFDFEIPDEDGDRITTVQEAVDYIARRQSGRQP